MGNSSGAAISGMATLGQRHSHTSTCQGEKRRESLRSCLQIDFPDITRTGKTTKSPAISESCQVIDEFFAPQYAQPLEACYEALCLRGGGANSTPLSLPIFKLGHFKLGHFPAPRIGAVNTSGTPLRPSAQLGNT